MDFDFRWFGEGGRKITKQKLAANLQNHTAFRATQSAVGTAVVFAEQFRSNTDKSWKSLNVFWSKQNYWFLFVNCFFEHLFLLFL